MQQLKKSSASLSTPPIVMTRHVLCRIMSTVAALPAETGGILLGPIGSDDVTGYFFDTTAQCTSVTYSPNHVLLRQKMKEEWLPYGIDFKGFVHSHPGTSAWLSGGDLTYIRRLLEINTDMNVFIAPIVIPRQFRIRPIVVLREQPDRPRETVLRIV
ncbi:MAG: UBA/ThiF-type NAD/FAD-binding protein [Phycisphaerales bacterium]|nr:UBA/ThiF-type NAD/FAD-binding protein [Phycisphaerales bacterium]